MEETTRTPLTFNSVAVREGIRLHYAERAGAGPTLIFVHGYTDSWRSFEFNLAHILRQDRARGLRILAIDLPGHGESSKPQDVEYTQSLFAGCLFDFMEALEIAKATVVGHSMGVLVGHKFAVEHPDRVERLVLVGGGATAKGNPAVAALLDMVSALNDPVDKAFIRQFQTDCFPDGNADVAPPGFVDIAISETAKVPAFVWKSALKGLAEEDHSRQLGNVNVPVLVLCGDKDGFFTLEDQLKFVGLLPRAKLLYFVKEGDEIPGGVAESESVRFVRAPAHTGHVLHVERAEQFENELLAFVGA